MVYEFEPIYDVQTRVDLLTDEVNEYANEEIKIFNDWVKVRTINHLTRLKKNALDKTIHLEKTVS